MNDRISRISESATLETTGSVWTFVRIKTPARASCIARSLTVITVNSSLFGRAGNTNM